MISNFRWNVLQRVLTSKLLLLVYCAVEFVCTNHHSCAPSPPGCCVGDIFCLLPWIASPGTYSAGTTVSWELSACTKPWLMCFLWAVSFKGGPQPPGNAEEMVFSCLLVSVLQLEQKVSFDLGIKEMGYRMLEKVEFWSLGTGREVGRTQNEQSHLATDGRGHCLLLWSLNHLLSLLFPRWSGGHPRLSQFHLIPLHCFLCAIQYVQYDFSPTSAALSWQSLPGFEVQV